MKIYLYFIILSFLFISYNHCLALNNSKTTHPVEISLKELPLKTALSVYVQINNISCFGNSDGSAKAIVTGGTPPYFFSWSTGATTDSIGGLTQGAYTISVTDATSLKIVGKINIIEPPELIIDIDSGNVDCEGNTSGWAVAKVTGGTFPYQYFWSNGSNKDSIGNLTPGTYSITIIDINGCTDSSKVTLQANPTPNFTVDILKNATCYGYGDGSATINITKGVQPFSYKWQTFPVYQTTDTAVNLKAGNYSIELTDSFNCPVTNSFTITQPAELIANIDSFTNISCYGKTDGSADISIGGGTPPYSYQWNTAPPKTSLSISDLSEGVYIFTITDSIGCNRNVMVNIIEPQELKANLATTDEKCLDDCNGQVDPNITGGTTPYTYLWSTSPQQTSEKATGLCVGNYSVTVTDKNNCVLQSETATISTVSPVKSSFTANPTFGIAALKVKFNYTGSATNSFLWDFGDFSTSPDANPDHEFKDAGLFNVILTVTTDTGCVDSSEQLIEVIEIVNAFTPDGDDINDIYMKGVEMVILNRWGKELYNGKEGWDGTYKGKKVSPGTYYYIITLDDPEHFGEKFYGSVTVVTN